MSNAANTNTHPGTAPETKPKLSRKERLTLLVATCEATLTKTQAKLAEAQAELSGIVLLENVAEGANLIVRVGRGENAKEVGAVVLGVKEEDDGVKKYRVQYGTGFDADLAVVTAGSIVSVISTDEAAPAGPVNLEAAPEVEAPHPFVSVPPVAAAGGVQLVQASA